MLLLTMHEWYGKHPRYVNTDDTDTGENIIGLITELNLSEALVILRDYEKYYNQYYDRTLELSLIAVSQIEYLSDWEIKLGRMEKIETDIVERIEKYKDGEQRTC